MCIYQVITKGNNSLIPLVLVRKLALYTEGKERPKKEKDSWWQFNKHENLHARLALGKKMSTSPRLLGRILKVYIEALMGFSHNIIHMVSTTPCFLKAVSLKMALAVGRVNRRYTPSSGVGVEEPQILQIQLAGQVSVTFSP